MSRTRKGFHLYIEVDPPVEAELPIDCNFC